MASINVTISLQTLFCFQGPDATEFGAGDASEPYMWTIMFVLDGNTITQSGNTLSGSPQFFFSPGSHGNLNSDIVSGQTIAIPQGVGTFTTNLQPIAISLAGVSVSVPGQIGLIVNLMEENNTSNDAVEAGHQALNDLVKQQLQQFIDGIRIDAVAIQVQDEMNSDSTLTPESATKQVFNQLISPFKQNIIQFAPSVVEAAIINNGGASIGSAIYADMPSGQATHVFSTNDLAQTNIGSPIKFVDFLTGDKSPYPSWGYNLHGEAYQRIKVWYTPAATSIPRGRFQISGVDKAMVSGSSVLWITHVGGLLGDGTPWVLSRADAVERILQGVNTFFVLGADQSQADVEVVQHDPRIGHPYLRTVPDNSVQDNLDSLPPCQHQVRHQVDV